MLKPKKKLCVECKEEQYIWRRKGRNLYCKSCWFKVKDIKPKPFKKTKPIKKSSSKMSAQLTVYTKSRKTFLEKYSMCEASLHNCTLQSTDVHHKKGRGKNLLDVTTWLSVCRSCHNWIETHPKQAVELGYSIKKN